MHLITSFQFQNISNCRYSQLYSLLPQWSAFSISLSIFEVAYIFFIICTYTSQQPFIPLVFVCQGDKFMCYSSFNGYPTYPQIGQVKLYHSLFVSQLGQIPLKITTIINLLISSFSIKLSFHCHIFMYK